MSAGLFPHREPLRYAGKKQSNAEWFWLGAVLDPHGSAGAVERTHLMRGTLALEKHYFNVHPRLLGWNISTIGRSAFWLTLALALIFTTGYAPPGGNSGLINATNVSSIPGVFEAYFTAEEHDVDIAGNTVHCMIYKDDPPAPFSSAGAGIPGPQIKVKVGETVIVHLKNNLPSKGTSIHWHGLELDNDSDGTAVAQDAVLPGQSYTYRFMVKRPGLFWYHPHMMPGGSTFAGMYGPIVVENNLEPNLKGTVLPTNANTHTLVLSDIQFNANGKVGKPLGPNGPFTTIDEAVELCHLFTQGDPGGNQLACSLPIYAKTVLVNGENPDPNTPSPKFVVPSGKRIRLRLFNAAISRHFHLRLLGSADNNIYRIGGEGGLLDNVVLDGGVKQNWNSWIARGELVLGPGDRADVIVVPSGNDGDIVQLAGDSLPNGIFLEESGLAGPYPIAYFQISGSSNEGSPSAGDPILEGTDEQVDNIKNGPVVTHLVDPAPHGGSSDETIRLTKDRPDGQIASPSIDGFSSSLDSNMGISSQWRDRQRRATPGLGIRWSFP
jgi:FtsP/CotA-like multicopper oxidase with cupredoxin domain